MGWDVISSFTRVCACSHKTDITYNICENDWYRIKEKRDKDSFCDNCTLLYSKYAELLEEESLSIAAIYEEVESVWANILKESIMYINNHTKKEIEEYISNIGLNALGIKIGNYTTKKDLVSDILRLYRDNSTSTKIKVLTYLNDCEDEEYINIMENRPIKSHINYYNSICGLAKTYRVYTKPRRWQSRYM